MDALPLIGCVAIILAGGMTTGSVINLVVALSARRRAAAIRWGATAVMTACAVRAALDVIVPGSEDGDPVLCIVAIASILSFLGAERIDQWLDRRWGGAAR